MARSPMPMEIETVGEIYLLSREQWRGNVAKITKDAALLKEVKKYTWTYKRSEKNNHPYLWCSKTGLSLHEFVLGFIYGAESIDKMQDEGNIIEHLDNDGLNCTYENLHMLSDDMNKAKAFSIDKRQSEEVFLPYILDVYYLHDKKQFQLQIYMNDDICFDRETGIPIEMFICLYNDFDNLYLDWFYLLKNRANKNLDIAKLNAIQIDMKERPMVRATSEEKNSPIIERDGVVLLNLDAKHCGTPMVSIRHTSLRKTEIKDEEALLSAQSEEKKES